MKTKLKNIDILNIGRECNQKCRQCFAVENNNRPKQTVDEEIKQAEKIILNNKGSSFFIYPKEITTSPELLEIINRVGQKYVMSNGKKIIERPEILNFLLENKMNITFSLFADEEEQLFWNTNSANEYEQIKKGIKFCAEQGIGTEIFTIVTPENIRTLPKLYDLSRSLFVSKINLLRLVPVGNAKNIDSKFIIKEPDLEELLSITDYLKEKFDKNDGNPYISFKISFGPDFYGKSVSNYLVNGNKNSWVSTNTLCPVVGNQYAGVSLKTGNVYWCYLLISDSDARIGTISEEGQIRTENSPDFSRESLKQNLRGICSKDSCEYQKLCLGGCRSVAYTFSKKKGEKDPWFAGMDLCRTKTKSRAGYKYGGAKK